MGPSSREPAEHLGERAVQSLAATPPCGLRAALLATGAEELLVLSYPLEAWAPSPMLTEAEADVARLVALGHHTGEIAVARGTSVRTVANQLASIYRKLCVGSRLELVARLATPRRDEGSRADAGGARGTTARASDRPRHDVRRRP